MVNIMVIWGGARGRTDQLCQWIWKRVNIVVIWGDPEKEQIKLVSGSEADDPSKTSFNSFFTRMVQYFNVLFHLMCHVCNSIFCDRK